MSNQRYTPVSKDEAIRQVTKGGHSVPEVAERLGISAQSLHKWVNAASILTLFFIYCRQA